MTAGPQLTCSASSFLFLPEFFRFLLFLLCGKFSPGGRLGLDTDARRHPPLLLLVVSPCTPLMAVVSNRVSAGKRRRVRGRTFLRAPTVCVPASLTDKGAKPLRGTARRMASWCGGNPRWCRLCAARSRRPPRGSGALSRTRLCFTAGRPGAGQRRAPCSCRRAAPPPWWRCRWLRVPGENVFHGIPSGRRDGTPTATSRGRGCTSGRGRGTFPSSGGSSTLVRLARKVTRKVKPVATR